MNEKKLSRLICLQKTSILLIALSLIVILHSLITVTAHGGFKSLNPYVISLIVAGSVALLALFAAITIQCYLDKNSTIKNDTYFVKFFNYTSSNFNLALCLASLLSLMAMAACSGMLMRKIKDIKSLTTNLTDFTDPLCIAFYTTLGVCVLTLLIHAIKNMVAPEKNPVIRVIFDSKSYDDLIKSKQPQDLTNHYIREVFNVPPQTSILTVFPFEDNQDSNGNVMDRIRNIGVGLHGMVR